MSHVGGEVASAFIPSLLLSEKVLRPTLEAPGLST